MPGHHLGVSAGWAIIHGQLAGDDGAWFSFCVLVERGDRDRFVAHIHVVGNLQRRLAPGPLRPMLW